MRAKTVSFDRDQDMRRTLGVHNPLMYAVENYENQYHDVPFLNVEIENNILSFDYETDKHGHILTDYHYQLRLDSGDFLITESETLTDEPDYLHRSSYNFKKDIFTPEELEEALNIWFNGPVDAHYITTTKLGWDKSSPKIDRILGKIIKP